MDIGKNPLVGDILEMQKNNYSTIGNQQGAPDAALVEKLVNSIDSVLMKNCLLRNTDPEGLDAPDSIKQAMVDFFQVKEGDLANLSTRKRNDMSQDIILAATGTRSNPNYVIVDNGEGQTPSNMPHTILSIGKTNKLKIPFVQGKFNMGGTGVFRFCSPDFNVQIIITKRCTDIKDEQDSTSSMWGFTVIRREAATDGRKSSAYKYLTDTDGSILSFSQDKLPIIPRPKKVYDDMSHGMFIKMIDYRIGGYRTNLLFDLNYRLALLMPRMAHPIRLVECREYRGHSFETTLSGLDVRLKDDRSSKVEAGYPNSFQFRALDQEFNGLIYVFKDGADISNYKKDEGIIFSINGQTHASLPKSFFTRTRNGIGLSYIADSLLVIVDCSKLDIKPREDLFMNSRDRLSDCAIKNDIEHELCDLLKNHEGLKSLQSLRRQKALSDRLSEEKPLVDVLTKILSKSPALSKLFIAGEALKIPINIKESGNTNDYHGKKHPTFFKIKHRGKNGNPDKTAPINHAYRVQFMTDVDNDYFSRDTEPGDIDILCNGVQCNNLKRSLRLFNGTATLTMMVPDGAAINDELRYVVHILDECIPYPIVEEFSVRLGREQELISNSNRGKRNPPSGKDDKKNNKEPEGLSLPKMNPFYHEDWEKYQADKNTALFIRNNGEDGYDFFINMENICLLNELKSIKDKEKIDLIKAQYMYCNVLIGMSVINFYDDDDEPDIEVEKQVKNISSMLSPIVLPMINVLGDLDTTAVNFNEEVIA